MIMEKNSYERRVYNSVDERSLSSVRYVSKIDRKTIPVAKQERVRKQLFSSDFECYFL